ncbi:hypothetical protein CRM22_007307 [Opisthorchis felineus]|uniref:Tr-type G domain-containing protein n=1 Tax=Opisthorchis felineus TaxID=147828 RepID=A0A4S2LII5_OPIFE|nr:hypothetical protein CRM22_007307 [Opisthorchis felineus]
MFARRADTLVSLVSDVGCIRNVCILAHVDHGKTTMADALLATNGIVSFRQAGKLRYMDNTEAEQERGITMKSSVVGLIFAPTLTNKAPSRKTFLVNLVDSPGHVDFASEVSTAVRLCDAAIVVVDVVEGVCPQTRTVLRQAWNERLTLILALNKIDRLVLELKLTPLQAYETLCRVLEQVNSVLAEMFTADVVRQRDEFWRFTEVAQTDTASESEGSQSVTYLLTDDSEHTDDSNLYFSPDRGNVVFASASDTWGFRPSDFVETWSKRLDVSVERLSEVIWGDFYISRGGGGDGGKCFFKPGAHKSRKKPVFVQLVLEPLWQTYQKLVIDDCPKDVSTMASKLGVQLDARAIRNTDSRGVLRALLMAWLPLGHNLLQTVTEVCPSPLNAVSADRAVHMLYGDVALHGSVQPTDSVARTSKTGACPVQVYQTSRLTLDSTYATSGASLAIQASSSSPDSPTIVFVAKVFWTDKLHVTGHRYPKPKTATQGTPSLECTADAELIEDTSQSNLQHTYHHSSSETARLSVLRSPLLATHPLNEVEFVALGRIFSGSVYPGQRVFVLGPKFDGSKVPSYLLDADPTDFPIGPVRLRSEHNDQDPMGHGSRSEDVLGTSPSASSCAAFSRSGSIGGSSGGLRGDTVYLRHVYVAVIVGVLQLLGGQHDLVEVAGPIPSGNIVGLTGPDLIAFLPKSGLLVSRLSLVAGASTDGTSSGARAAPVLPLAGLAVWQGAPVISVAVEPASAANPEDVYRLERGLRLLDRADPCAEVSISPTGEYLIRAAGEVHLQKCLEDMTKYFAPDVELQISPFVVPFRETVVDSCPVHFNSLALTATESYDKAYHKLEEIYQKLEQHGGALSIPSTTELPVSTEACSEDASPVPSTTVHSETEHSIRTPITVKSRPSINPARKHSKRDVFDVDADLPDCPIGYFQLPHSRSQTRVLIRVTAHALPEKLIQWTEQRGSRKIPQLIRAFKTKSSTYHIQLTQFKAEFAEVCASVARDQSASVSDGCDQSRIDWEQMSESFLALGPNQAGPNMLFTRLQTNCFPVFTAWGQEVRNIVDATDDGDERQMVAHTREISLPLISYGKALLRGFQLASERGPLCAEPMRGVLFILEEICAEDCYFLEVPKLPKDPSPSELPNHYCSNEQVPEPVTSVNSEDFAKEQLTKNRKARRRFASVSWLDEGDDADEYADLFSDDAEGDWDWQSDESQEAVSEQESSSESETDKASQGKPDAARELIKELKDIPYWKRRSDPDWLQDVTPGLLTSAMNRACLAAFQACPGQRLMLAMYDVELQARPDVLGRMFAVLRKRHGLVVSEDFREGENLFVINARLPVIESFGLAAELRSKTSGIVSLPQLRPGGWELLDVDAVQRDGDALAKAEKSHKSNDSDRGGKKASINRRGEVHCGKGKKNVPAPTGADSDEEPVDELTAQFARVRNYIREVRLRKGLPTNEQLVLFADKQRTLKKNK